MNQAIRLLSLAIMQAKTGIDYMKGEGAYCPFCRHKLRVYTTLKGRPKVRYCRCTHHGCPVCDLGTSIKTVQK